MKLPDPNLRALALLLLLTVARTIPAMAQAAEPAASSPIVTPALPSILEEARELFEKARYDEVIKRLSGATPPPNAAAEFNYLLGISCYQQRDYQRAVDLLETVVANPQEKTRSYRESVQALGLAHYLLGHLKEGIPYLEKTREWAPENTEINYTLGMSYLQTHQPDKSREAFARTFQIAPDSAAARLLAAQMMQRLQFEEFAEREVRQALELNPRLPAAHYLLGELAIFHARPEEGIAEMLKEIEINPAFSMAYWRLGDAYTRLLKWDEAIPPLQKAIWLNPYFSGPFIVLGKVYLKKKDYANAEGILRRAIQMDPNNKSAHYLMAQVYQQTGRAEDAKREFTIADKLQDTK